MVVWNFLRYHNNLNPAVKLCDWTVEEERELFSLHEKYGNKWTQIAEFFPGRSLLGLFRTGNNVKNHFYCIISKGIRRINRFLASSSLSS